MRWLLTQHLGSYLGLWAMFLPGLSRAGEEGKAELPSPPFRTTLTKIFHRGQEGTREGPAYSPKFQVGREGAGEAAAK